MRENFAFCAKKRNTLLKNCNHNQVLQKKYLAITTAFSRPEYAVLLTTLFGLKI